MVDPFMAQELNILPLCNQLSDAINLKFLYPDIPKEAILSKITKEENDQPSQLHGYVKRRWTVSLEW